MKSVAKRFMINVPDMLRKSENKLQQTITKREKRWDTEQIYGEKKARKNIRYKINRSYILANGVLPS